MLWDRLNTIVSMVNLFYLSKRKKKCLVNIRISVSNVFVRNQYLRIVVFFSISSDWAFPPLEQTDYLIERGYMIHVLQSIEL